MKRFLGLVLVLGCLLVGTGCEKLTPEARAKIEAQDAQIKALGSQLVAAKAVYDRLMDEYRAIKMQVDAGVPVTQAMKDRLTEITPKLIEASGVVKNIFERYQAVDQNRKEIAAAGVKWYWQIPWTAIISAVGGAAGLYFAKSKPAIQAAQGLASTLVTAIKDYNTLPDSDPREIKDVVLETALAQGTADKIHALAQELDPKAPKAN